MSGPEHVPADVAPQASVEPLRCTAHARTTGQRCGNAPIKGLTVCRMHGGSTAAAKAKSERIVAQRGAARSARRLGVPVEVDPAQALLEALYSAMGDLRFWEEVSSALEFRHGSAEGIVGVNHLGDQAVHVAARELADAQRRVAQISKWCIEANIGERRLQLIEAEAAATFDLIVVALQKLGLDSPEVRVGLAAEFRARALRADAFDVESEEL